MMASALRRNSFWLLLSRVTSQGLTLLFIALVARKLGVTGFGQFNVIATIVMIGNIFTSFGTDPLLVRETAHSGQVTPLASRALTLQLFLSVLWLSATVILHPEPSLFLYSLILLPLTIFSIAVALVRGFERMDLFWALSLANGLIQLLAVLFSKDLWTLCLSLLIGQVIVSALSIWICSASFPAFNLLPFRDFRPLFFLVWPFAALTTIAMISQRLGILSVSMLMDDKATGLFSSVVRLIDGLKLGHTAVFGAMLPALSRGTNAPDRDFKRGFFFLLTLSFFIAVIVFAFAPDLVTLFFGVEFSPAVQPLRLLVWVLLPYTVSAYLSVDLIARNAERILLLAMAVSVLLLAMLFAILIPAFGTAGASWAALIGETIQAIILFLLARLVLPGIN